MPEEIDIKCKGAKNIGGNCVLRYKLRLFCFVYTFEAEVSLIDFKMQFVPQRKQMNSQC